MNSVVNFLIAFAFVLLFALPGNIHWLVKRRKDIPTCRQEEIEYKTDKRQLILVNIIAIVVTLVIAGVVWVF